MSAPDAPLASSRNDAGEARRLVDLLSRWAGEARAALESNDLDLLEQILDERESIAARLEVIFEAGLTAQAESDVGGDPDTAGMQRESELEAVIGAAGHARNAEALLSSTFESEMARISRELDQMESDQAVRSAYGQGSRKRRQINILR